MVSANAIKRMAKKMAAILTATHMERADDLFWDATDGARGQRS